MRLKKPPIEPQSQVSQENTISLLCITTRKPGQNEAGNPEDDTRQTGVARCSGVALTVKVKEVQTRKINEESCAELTSCGKFHSRQFYTLAAPGRAGRDADQEAAVN